MTPVYTTEQATEDLLGRAAEYFSDLEARLTKLPEPTDKKKLAEYWERCEFVQRWNADILALRNRQLQEIALPHLKPPEHINDWEYA